MIRPRPDRWAPTRPAILAPLLFAFLAVIPAPESLAQQRHFSGDPVWFSGPADRTLINALGDVDGDGDLDLVGACASNHGYPMSTLYLNEGGAFASTPAWVSFQNHYCVSLGDIDGDGNLDMVAGGWPQGIMLYRNLGGFFGAEPSWEIDDMATPRAIALGDVDNDGDLDLVSGAAGGTMHRNVDGTFEDTPAWVAELSHLVYSVDLGDIDGDGFIDLVCGNPTRANTVYLNVSGTFDTASSWISVPENDTYGVALGDMDGDGDLDLVCANRRESSTFYRNVGGMLETVPSLVWGASDRTKSVTLGDEDGDGDLDVVFGNFGTPDRLYENVAGNIDTTGVWASGRSDDTNSVLFGDVDGDGELDLVCGNSGQANTVYRNVGGPFETVASWSGESSFRVVLGDVDGDDDLDLVSAGLYGPNTLHLNQGGALDTVAVWSSGEDWSRSVALGDIDGDDDLDLVCGNQDRPNTAYINQGVGMLFSTTAVPLSNRSERTLDIALGDVDLDGDLDLISAHQITGTHTGGGLYLNTGGAFDTTSVWTGEEWQEYVVIALGDIDGDRDLDLVCAGYSGKALYINSGGRFETVPAWSLSRYERTAAIALADVDGDSDLDLVCGNSDVASTLYRNIGGRFEDTPLFSWGRFSEGGVSLGDVDQDGDLDVACAYAFYRNVLGRFETPPIWSADGGGSGVVLGDLDGDSDLDLVCAAQSTGSTFYRNISHASRNVNRLAPANHLPNNPAGLTEVGVEDVDERYKRIHLTVSDIESDPVRVFLDFQFEDAASWFPVEGEGLSGVTGLLDSSPAGLAASLDWDLSRLPFDRRDVVLRLRAVEVPAWVSRMQSVDSRLFHVGAVVPRRPELTLSSTILSFEPSVTVGDTLTEVLAFSNTGTDTLRVTQIMSPSSELIVDPPAPYEIPPGEQELATFLLVPREQTDISGQMQVSSNDLLEPVAPIAIESQIRALEITSRLLAPADSIPPGEAVTVIVTPAREVRVEKGFLYFRPSGGAEAFPDSIELSPSGDDFIAVIPGENVTEVGLDYYARVENSGIFRTDPPGAPEDSVFFQAVRAPGAITATVLANSGNDVVAGLDANVQVLLDDGVEFVDGTLHARAGGAATYDSHAFQRDGALLTATVPAGAVGARGLEYWVEIETATTTLTDPPVDPVDRPHTVQIVVPALSEGASPAPEARYRLVTVPLGFETDRSFADLLGDDAAFGPYDPDRWRSFRYVPGVDGGHYVEIGDPSVPDANALRLGCGYWLISREAGVIDTNPVPGMSSPTEGPYPVVVEPGWNQIGSPFLFPVARSSVTRSSDVIEDPVEFDPAASSAGAYLPDPPEILQPFRGYFVHNAGAQPETLWVPPVEAVAPASAAPGPLAGAMDAGWRLRIDAASDAPAADDVTVGIDPLAHDAFDALDRRQAPPPPSAWVTVAAANPDWPDRPGLYRRDLRTIPLDGHRWDLELRSESRGELVTLTTSLSGTELPAAIRILDLEQEAVATLGEGERYALVSLGPDRPYRVAILAGTDDYVAREADHLASRPATLSLDPVSPNPFRSATRMRFGLPATQSVTLAIHDVTGRRIATLVDRRMLPAGYHTTIWDGRDASGSRAASGVYFVRVDAGNDRLTRKLLVLR